MDDPQGMHNLCWRQSCEAHLLNDLPAALQAKVLRPVQLKTHRGIGPSVSAPTQAESACTCQKCKSQPPAVQPALCFFIQLTSSLLLV